MVEQSDYFLERAEQQLSLARAASDDRVAQAHFELAGRYWDRAFNPAEAAAGVGAIGLSVALIGQVIADLHGL